MVWGEKTLYCSKVSKKYSMKMKNSIFESFDLNLKVKFLATKFSNFPDFLAFQQLHSI